MSERVTEQHIEVGVVLARRRTAGMWSQESWRPIAALAAAPPLESGAFVAHAEGDDLFYAGAVTLSLHASDTAHYRDNLNSGRPAIWIAIASGDAFPHVQAVTADPYEGEALAEVYGEGLDAVFMPEAIVEVLSRFVAEHHVERVFIKRKRT